MLFRQRTRRSRLAGAATIASALYAAPAASFVSRRVGGLFGVASAIADRNAVALTFDDGPHPQGTPAVLDRLAEFDVRATFFVTGEQVARNPALAREIAAAGHELALHGYRHRFQLSLGPGGTWDDILRARDELTQATGVDASFYRPPYGVANAAAIVSARKLGLRVVLWTRWGRDWERGASPQSVASLATRRLTGGEIVLLHDADHYSAENSWSVTAKSVTLILTRVLELGLAVRTVGDAIPV